MSINKLSTIKSYWQCGQFIVNDGIRNVMARLSFEDILRNLHFRRTQKMTKVTKSTKFTKFTKFPYQPFEPKF